MGGLCGHKAADMGHQHDECRLTQQSRFTGHIRARDHHDLGSFRTTQTARTLRTTLVIRREADIVGYITFAYGHLTLDNGMATLTDVDDQRVVHIGAHIVILCCHAAERQQAIESCHQLRIDLDDGDIFFERLEKVEIKFLLEAADAFLGIQDFLFVLFQFLRDVSLGSYQGLLAYPSFRHLIAMSIAHFDVIAENAVERHLERWDLVFL